MTRALFSRIFTTGLTIFAMMFGAGNLIFPTRLGVEAGGHAWIGFLGFALSGILLPMLGLMAIVAFDGDYEAYFSRLGRTVGNIFIFICMMIIGPFIVMPRIVALAHELLLPLWPGLPISVFATFFGLVAFLIAYRLSKVLDVIGKILSPLKILSLISVIILGLWGVGAVIVTPLDVRRFFFQAMADGYQTLDLLASIFFGAIIVNLLSRYVKDEERVSVKKAVTITAFAGIFAGILLGLIYLGMIYLGVFYGEGLIGLGEGEIFRQIVLRVAGRHGALLIGFVVLAAGLTTTVPLATVLGDYVRRVSHKKISYSWAVCLVLIVCALMASLGLTNIIDYSKPLIYFFYPLLIVLTVCNLLYKVVGFMPVKLPVFVTAVIMAWLRFFA